MPAAGVPLCINMRCEQRMSVSARKRSLGGLFWGVEDEAAVTSGRISVVDAPWTWRCTQAIDFTGEPGWDRTNDPLIKSQMLYR